MHCCCVTMTAACATCMQMYWLYRVKEVPDVEDDRRLDFRSVPGAVFGGKKSNLKEQGSERQVKAGTVMHQKEVLMSA